MCLRSTPTSPLAPKPGSRKVFLSSYLYLFILDHSQMVGDRRKCPKSAFKNTLTGSEVLCNEQSYIFRQSPKCVDDAVSQNRYTHVKRQMLILRSAKRQFPSRESSSYPGRTDRRVETFCSQLNDSKSVRDGLNS